MKAVFKFPIVITDKQLVMMPEGAEILSVALVKHETVIYAMVDQSAPMANRWIVCRGTGHDIKPSDKLYFIGTVVYRGGELVFHFFEQTQ